MIRKIVEINEKRCTGCGACANACHENAIVMINGKAKLIKDDYCDGFGDCLPACPADAISIIKREANEYDEEAVKLRMQESNESLENKIGQINVCPGSKAMNLKTKKEITNNSNIGLSVSNKEFKSRLMQWPVQIKLVPINATYFKNADLLIAADCTAYSYANFHEDFIKDHITLIGCTKLDDIDYSDKLREIIKSNDVRSIKVVKMEVPCCSGLERAAISAIEKSGKDIPYEVVTITYDGNIINS